MNTGKEQKSPGHGPLPQQPPQASALSAEDIARFGPDPTHTLRQNLAAVRERIAAACGRCGRRPDEVRLLAVTKTVPAHVLRHACAAGMTDFGENKVQEGHQKWHALGDLPIRWSLIGHLQTNKVKYLTQFASQFHALDSFRLADALNRRLEAEQRDLEVFVQVNTSGESSKYGLQPDELLPFVERLSDYPRLKPRGLMTLALFSAQADRVRECFRRLRVLRDRALQIDPQLSQLSMGMSGDFEIAIEEGADIVRVGQAIFGVRPGGDAQYWPGLIPEPPIPGR